MRSSKINRRIETVVAMLLRAGNDIDDLGEDIAALKGRLRPSRDPDQVACYASNGLEGPLALLKELRAMVPMRKARRL